MPDSVDFSVLKSVLYRGLSLCRPYNGTGELEFREHIRGQITAHSESRPYCDGFGNLWVIVPKLDGTDARIIFTAHLDTVHLSDGPNSPVYDRASRIVYADGTIPLGADDGAGAAILAGFITARIPGTYVFTRGEEKGGKGAKYVSDIIRPGDYDMAIAFDRRGKFDLCGSQMGVDLASHKFVSSLAESLALGHTWADGVYTDNAEFSDKITEIVNLSVGYNLEHTKNESLDLDYLYRLYFSAKSVQWESLPVIGPDPYIPPYYGAGGYAGDYADPLIDSLDDIARDLCESAYLRGWESDIIPFLSEAWDRGYNAGLSEGMKLGRERGRIRRYPRLKGGK